MNSNQEIENSQKVFFELDDDAVFETVLATLQHSIVGN